MQSIRYGLQIKGDIDSMNIGVYGNAVITPLLSLYSGVDFGTSEIGAYSGGYFLAAL